MNTNNANNKKETREEINKQKQQDARLKYFIQAIDIKQDTGMTRIYSALQQIKNS